MNWRLHRAAFSGSLDDNCASARLVSVQTENNLHSLKEEHSSTQH
eukprot:jgi/Antlo1/1409/1376